MPHRFPSSDRAKVRFSVFLRSSASASSLHSYRFATFPPMTQLCLSLRNASTPQGTGLFLVKRWGTGTNVTLALSPIFALHLHNAPLHHHTAKGYWAFLRCIVHMQSMTDRRKSGAQYVRCTPGPLQCKEDATETCSVVWCWCFTPLRFYDALRGEDSRSVMV